MSMANRDAHIQYIYMDTVGDEMCVTWYSIYIYIYHAYMLHISMDLPMDICMDISIDIFMDNMH